MKSEPLLHNYKFESKSRLRAWILVLPLWPWRRPFDSHPLVSRRSWSCLPNWCVPWSRRGSQSCSSSRILIHAKDGPTRIRCNWRRGWRLENISKDLPCFTLCESSNSAKLPARSVHAFMWSMDRQTNWEVRLDRIAPKRTNLYGTVISAPVIQCSLTFS